MGLIELLAAPIDWIVTAEKHHYGFAMWVIGCITGYIVGRPRSSPSQGTQQDPNNT
jgi:hypothetical protein